MSSKGDCFVVLPPITSDDAVIVGRNSDDENDVAIVQEVFFYNSDEVLNGETDGGTNADIDCGKCSVVLQKPKPGCWGGDYGANSLNVCICIANEIDAENDEPHLTATDIVRLALAIASSAEDAVDAIGSLIAKHGTENAKMSFVVCDPHAAWSVACCGKLWAAASVKSGFHRFPPTGLGVTSKIDKSSEGLSDALKLLELWNGEGELNVAKCFGFASEPESEWPGEAPLGDGHFGATNMFETLRKAVSENSSRSATVSVLFEKRISCHWFTATPNARESVFKPFVFAPNPKISPLTKVSGDSGVTLLYKLHAQRKPSAMENLKALEASCVEEVHKYLKEHPEADEELDELMKDCVEAEVKFYR